MAPRAGAAVILAFAVCCLLVAPAPARRPVDLPRQLPDTVDRGAAAEKLLPEPVVQVPDDAEAADQANAIAVPEEEGADIAVQEEGGTVGEERPHQRSSLLCLVFRCGSGAELASAGAVAVGRGSSQERQALDGWDQPAVAEAAEEAHGEEQGSYDSDSDWDSDSDSDEDEDEEGGILGWFWRLAEEGGILGWFCRLADGF